MFTLLFIGNVPRGVFCEQSSQKTRELRREIMLCMISVHREGQAQSIDLLKTAAHLCGSPKIII